jgi:hypothetical protein
MKRSNMREVLTRAACVAKMNGNALPCIPTCYAGDSGVVSKPNPHASKNNRTVTPVKYATAEHAGATLTPRNQAALSVLRNAFGEAYFPRFGEVKVTLKNGKIVERAFGLDAGVLNYLIHHKFITPEKATPSEAINPGARFMLTQHALTFELNEDVKTWEQSPQNELKIYQPPKPAAPVAAKKPIRPRAPAAKRAPATV